MSDLLGDISITIDESIQLALVGVEESYNAASDYSVFQGATSGGYEAGWYGFKRASGKDSYAIIMMGYQGFCKAIRTSAGTWNVYKML